MNKRLLNLDFHTGLHTIALLIFAHAMLDWQNWQAVAKFDEAQFRAYTASKFLWARRFNPAPPPARFISLHYSRSYKAMGAQVSW